MTAALEGKRADCDQVATRTLGAAKTPQVFLPGVSGVIDLASAGLVRAVNTLVADERYIVTRVEVQAARAASHARALTLAPGGMAKA